MKTTKCLKCGTLNLAPANACKHCGAPLAADNETAAAPSTQSAAPVQKTLASRWGAGLFLLLMIGAGIYNWHTLINQRYYYPKLAFFAPFGVVLLAAMAISPGSVNQPKDMRHKIHRWIILSAAFALGALNFYLMGWVY